MTKRDLPEKPCQTCGRMFAYRKKWARDWAEVRHCSERCRRGGGPEEDRWTTAILALLAQRSPGATICPSEVARALGGKEWRDAMDEVRAAARRLVTQGKVVITQGGDVVDADVARGPIRIRLR